ncbi:MAG: T9SS type A sorting domain-containing protein [Cytophagales bacterium]|nr:T9SS type A sorting domain-containing protein [Cytophagales bacterium]
MKGVFSALFIFSWTLLLAQSGPGGVSTPTNNIFWLRSDKGITFDGSDNVTTWSDQANANNATNAASVTNPVYDNTAAVGTNSEPGILFAGSSSEFLDIADDNSINTTSVTARTVYIVFQTGADITTQQYLYEQGGTTNGLFFYIQGGQLSAGINSSSSNYSISSAASSIVASTAYIAVLTYDGTSQTLDLQLDGTASTQVTSVATSVATHTTIKVGSDGASGNYYTGHIAEIIYYDVVLNDGEIRMVNNYVSEKYGITTSNDHYSSAGATYRYELTGISRVNSAEQNTSNGLGGTLYLSENPSDVLADDEHVMAGHDNNNQDNSSTDMGSISGSDRYNRIWYFEKTGTVGLRVEFDVVEAGQPTPTDANDYQLARRAGTSGPFTEVTVTKSLNGDRVRFDVTDANFSSGYFTLGFPSVAKKWYVINSGTWDDPNTWTLDPAGIIFNNPENLTPSSSPSSSTDEVIIGSGKTVTLDNDADIPNPLTKLTVDGTLDFVSTSGHGTITELVGNGTIRSSGDDASTPRLMNFPTFTDASNFTSAGTGAGTFEFYGSEDLEISAASSISTFYNIVVNLTSAADDELIITTDIAINGDLTLTSGNFQINDLSTTRLIIDLSGNLVVASAAEISVGTGIIGTPTDADDYHDTFHRFNISGNFTNSGTVNFTNQVGYVYNAYPTNGDAVTVNFTGQSDNTLTCTNTTNFYDFILDKGDDQTYTLTVNSSAINNFRILGQTRLGATINNLPNPTIGKSLWIKAGTLRLTGTIFIPSLSEAKSLGGANGSWVIPEKGALWIDGANVTVWATAETDAAIEAIDTDLAGNVSGVVTGTGSQQALYLTGNFRISDGVFHSRNGSATFYSEDGPATFQIEGGTVDINQLRANGASPTGNPVYNQSGGTFTVNGESQAIGGSSAGTTAGIFDFTSTNGVFIMSGGSLVIRDYNNSANAGSINGLNIDVPVGNHNVTGGTIEVDIEPGFLSTDGFEIVFTPNFYNLSISADDDDFVTFSGDLEVTNDLILSSGTDTRLNGNNLTVGRNLNVIAGATYTQGGNNATSFVGNSDQIITLAGTLTTDFYDVTFSGSDTKTLVTGDLTATNSLSIASGATVNDGGQTIFIENTITNSGTHESTTGGEVEFSGGSATYTVAGDGTGVFGNVILNDATNDVSFSANQTITETLTFSQDQLLDINTSGLTMQGANAVISGASSVRYIQSAGNASDGGLELYINGDGNYTFPIGTDSNNDPPNSTPYTPVIYDMAASAGTGYIQISIADIELPTIATNTDGLTYYWRVRHRDFSATDDIVTSITIDFDDSDGDDGSVDNNDNYYGGWVLDEAGYTRERLDNECDWAGNQLVFDGDMNGDTGVKDFDLLNANYTAGPTNAFNGTVNVFYSIDTPANWDDNTTWSFGGHAGTAVSNGECCPGAGDIAIIGYNGGDGHRIRAIGNVDASILVFDSPTGANAKGGDLATLQFGDSENLNSNMVSGFGRLQFQYNGTGFGIISATADLGDFVSTTDSDVYYTLGSGADGDGDITITALDEYPSISFWANGANGSTPKDDRFVLDRDISCSNMLINGNAALYVDQNITIADSLWIGFNTDGEMIFHNGTAVTVEVEDILFETTAGTTTENINRIIVESGGGNDVDHTIRVSGDIHMRPGSSADAGAEFDLYNGGTDNNVILELTGSGTHSFERTSITAVPDLHQVVMNKGSDQTSTFSFNTDFTLPVPAASFQPIGMQNGILILNDAGIGAGDDLELTNTTNGTSFSIPGTAGLQISAGKAMIPSGIDIGITLDGLLQIDGAGELDMVGGDNNFIEYSSSGSATITVGGTGILSVGSQIRQSDANGGGILNYTQTGGAITIGEDVAGSPATNRSMFEVSGTGSSFSMTGGTLIIANDVSTSGVPTLYLDPDGTPVISSPAMIQFGSANTVSGNNAMTIQSTVDLFDLTVDNSAGAGNYPTLTQLNVPLTVTNDLIIEANTNLDASGLALTIGRDFDNTDGASGFTANSNTTTFNGSVAQTITGNGTTFYNLTKSTANTLDLAAGTDITISNDFRIESGTLDDNNNDISVSGILHNASIHTNNNASSTNNGIILAGSNEQDITGGGTFSRIRINNTSGATTSADVSITEQVILNGGVLDIQGNALAMDDDAIFVDGSGGGFSSTNMVETRRSFTDAGVKKTYNGTAASPFTYPIGSGDKYTPVIIALTQNSQTTATISVRAADEPHPNVQEDVDVPEFVDQDNVLQYYWEVTSAGMTDFIGSLEFTYEGTDAYVTSPFTLDDYHTARLLPDASDNWNKLSTGFKYQSVDGENTVTFTLSSAATDDEIGGDYTAGIEDAVPDQVQTVTSIVSPSGDWTTTGSWDTGAVPTGAIVIIDAGDLITLDTDAQLVYRTQINGELLVGTTINHRLGAVSGTGTMRVESGSLPAGTYDDFFNCSTGGSVDFGGASSYTLPNEIASIRNLEISDGGTKSFPNVDVVICGDLVLDDGATLNNPQNRSITVLGDLIITNGTLSLGSGGAMTVQGNCTVTAGTFNIDNNSLTVNGSLSLDGGTINLGTNGTLDVDTDFTVDGGTLNGANSSSLNIGDDLTLTSGTFSVDGTTTTITFDGTAVQVITGDFTGTSAFRNLTINKSAGGVTVVDVGNNDVEIDGTLTLTSGAITTNSANTLTITSTGDISGGSASSYVNGPLTRSSLGVGEDFTFHVGSSIEYALAGVENVGTGGQDWTAEFFGTNANSSQAIDITTNPAYGTMSAISTNGAWTITASGANTATVVLGIQGHMDVQDLADARVAVYDNPTATEWVNIGGSSTGTISDGIITSQTTGSFSSRIFSLGGIGGSALPVEVIEFVGSEENGIVTLNWSTATELNNDYFDVERSPDGIIYERIGTVDGNGTTKEVRIYNLKDTTPFLGVNYYRLKQVDYDGEFEYSNTIRVSNNFIRAGLEVTVYPNPTTNENLNIQMLSGDSHTPISIRIVDIAGRGFFAENLEASLEYDHKIRTMQKMSSGVYFVTIKQGNFQEVRKLIIQ